MTMLAGFTHGQSAATKLVVKGGFVYFKPPYWNEWFYETVATIPVSDRRWYRNAKVWAFRVEHRDAVAKLVREAFCSEPEQEER